MWLLATPLCVIVAAAIGVTERRPVTFLVTAAWIVLVPLGALGAAAWVGIRWPYHPLPLRDRWAGRRRWRPMLLRWALLIFAPFVVVPFLTAALAVPSVLLWWSEGHGGRVTDGQFATGVLLTAVLAAVAWPAAHRGGARLARRRREQLTAYLSDPARG
jgi:polyferredoxin